MRDALHFAHGNGFPSPCYRQLMLPLEKRFDCYMIDRLGHDTRFPVTEHWRYLVEEVIVSIKSQTTKPVIGLGHSLGGVLSLLAAIEEPSLFKAVILLDSPLLGRFKSHMIRVAKALGIIDKVTPAHRTRLRREFWSTKEEARAYLKSRPLFKTFTDACLEDYITYGLQKHERGYTLRFDRRIEYAIYRTIPHVIHSYEGRLKVPAALIYGTESTVVRPLDVRYMQKYYGMFCFETPGTHMLPMEHPKDLAKRVMDITDKLLESAA